MSGQAVTAPFVGRLAEFETLRDALYRAGEGEVVAALVAGEAGIGKTRLVTEIVELAGRTGSRTLVGRCPDLEGGGAPLAPVRDAIGAMARELPPAERSSLLGTAAPLLEPGAGEGEGETAPGWVFDVVQHLLERLGADGPVVLAIDDLHWADPSTRDLLAFLATASVDAGVLLVATYRDVPALSPPLANLVGELDRQGGLHLRLGPFDAVELEAHLEALLGHQPGTDLLAAIAARSEGNPFFIEELATATIDEPGGVEPGATIPRAVHQAMLGRVAGLTPDGQTVVRAAAVAGQLVAHALLSAITASRRR